MFTNEVRYDEFILKAVNILRKNNIYALCFTTDVFKAFATKPFQYDLRQILRQIDTVFQAHGVKDYIVLKRTRRPFLVNIRLSSGKVYTAKVYLGQSIVREELLRMFYEEPYIVDAKYICGCTITFGTKGVI